MPFKMSSHYFCPKHEEYITRIIMYIYKLENCKIFIYGFPKLKE